jgi:hypothetical protein
MEQSQPKLGFESTNVDIELPKMTLNQLKLVLDQQNVGTSLRKGKEDSLRISPTMRNG